MRPARQVPVPREATKHLLGERLVVAERCNCCHSHDDCGLDEPDREQDYCGQANGNDSHVALASSLLTTRSVVPKMGHGRRVVAGPHPAGELSDSGSSTTRALSRPPQGCHSMPTGGYSTALVPLSCPLPPAVNSLGSSCLPIQMACALTPRWRELALRQATAAPSIAAALQERAQCSQRTSNSSARRPC